VIRLRLRRLVAGFNHAVSGYTLARLEIASAHPRIVAPPIVDRLGAGLKPDGARAWRTAIRQIRGADAYVRTGASAVARRHEAWAQLAGAFESLRECAAGIEALRTQGARVRRRRSS